ncbi:MAG: cysteine desulfurase family protein [Acidobacteriaceae bacterium]
MPKAKRIYLDHAATTPIAKEVSLVMADFDRRQFGNPSSIHHEGQEARASIDSARADIAEFFNCLPQEIIFTSGATEANNLAIAGCISDYVSRHNAKPHVITTILEHQSVFNTVKTAYERGIIEATFVEPDKNGITDPKKIVAEIRDNTILISLIFVSNEIGTLQPVRELGKLLAEYNSKSRQKIIFHTDAVQAVKFYNCNVKKLGVDLLTFSGHKINGPKGIGGLFIKAGSRLNKIQFGGSQEYEKRAGTQNTTGIIGMSRAILLLGSLENRESLAKKIRKLKDHLADFAVNQKIQILGDHSLEKSCPDILTLYFKNLDQDTLLARLDVAGYSVSNGSACSSGSTNPSNILKALHVPGKGAVVRISLGKSNTLSEIEKLEDLISNLINRGSHPKKLLAKT